MLQDKVILVTGAAGGIGQAAAHLFAAAGAVTVLVDRDSAGLDALTASIAETGARVEAAIVDITSEGDVAALIDSVVARHGRIDGAFNNAGIEQANSALHETPLEAWARTIAVDLTGAFLCMKHEIRAMLQVGNDGSIVNTSSGLGLVAIPQAADYIAAKHGVVGLTKAAAVEYGSRGIRVNAILPGMVQTPMLERGFDDPVFSAKIDMLRAAHPIGRLAQPLEIAQSALWLLSNASSFVTGVALPVDGGYVAA